MQSDRPTAFEAYSSSLMGFRQERNVIVGHICSPEEPPPPGSGSAVVFVSDNTAIDLQELDGNPVHLDHGDNDLGIFAP